MFGPYLFEAYLAQPNNFIIAAVRGDYRSFQDSIASMQKGYNTRWSFLEMAAAEILQTSNGGYFIRNFLGLSWIDVITVDEADSDVLNIGPSISTGIMRTMHHVMHDVVQCLALYQRMFPLLKKAPQPKLVFISWLSMSAIEQDHLYTSAYGVSKSAVHYLLKKMHFENDRLIAFAIELG